MKYFIFFLKFILLVSVLYIIIGLIFINLTGINGVNKTVGYGWDLYNHIIPISIIYVATYLSLYILKTNLNLIFSIFTIVLLILFYKINRFSFTLFSISILLFLSNCMYSIYLKFKKE